LARAGKHFFFQERGDFVIGAPDGVPNAPAPFCGKTGGPSIEFLFPPMLFARHTLASGPQECFYPGKRMVKITLSKG
jgi:hypothetical protein